jgi:hypothetical protein
MSIDSNPARRAAQVRQLCPGVFLGDGARRRRLQSLLVTCSERTEITKFQQVMALDVLRSTLTVTSRYMTF